MFPVGNSIERVVGDRVEQHLLDRCWPITIASHQRGHCGQIASCAIASHSDSIRIPAEAFYVVNRSLECAVGVDSRRWKGVFWRPPIVDGEC